jgi:NAD-dependent dihydropyrimidine dehydrogenase PreA subunit
MAFVIAQPCVDVKDKACIEECPVDCIYEGPRKMYIHPGECVDCGACEPVCPVEAVFYEDSVPAEWADYATADRGFFAGLGSPGGAAATDPADADHPLVATRPQADPAV